MILVRTGYMNFFFYFLLTCGLSIWQRSFFYKDMGAFSVDFVPSIILSSYLGYLAVLSPSHQFHICLFSISSCLNKSQICNFQFHICLFSISSCLNKSQICNFQSKSVFFLS
jgi:hypothetical protein